MAISKTPTPDESAQLDGIGTFDAFDAFDPDADSLDGSEGSPDLQDFEGSGDFESVEGPEEVEGAEGAEGDEGDEGAEGVAAKSRAGADPRLPATSWAVLGMLTFEQELSGYDIKKWADASLRLFYWSPSFSQIYGELKRLERHGYVTSRTVMQDEVRGKRVYAVTDAGRRAARRWARDAAVETPVLKHGVLLRVWLGHLAEPERLREIVAEHRENSEKRRAEAAEDAEEAGTEPVWAHPELALKWAERYHAAERDLADRMLADLDAMVAAGRGAKPRSSRRKSRGSSSQPS